MTNITHLRIGRKSIPVSGLENASRTYQAVRDQSGKGQSTFPQGHLTIDGIAYRISYNGRVWNGATVTLEAAR